MKIDISKTKSKHDSKEYRYLSFDISTKSKFYKKHYYSTLKNYLTKTLDFKGIKDSNYISLKPITNDEKLTIERKIASRYPNIVLSMNKFNGSVWQPISNSDTLGRLQTFAIEKKK